MDNLKLIPGMIITTNYSDRKHKVIRVFRHCRCPRYSDELGYTKTGMEKESPEHIHIVCKDLKDNMRSFFGGFVELENEISSIWIPTDKITIVSKPKNYQLELFN